MAAVPYAHIMANMLRNKRPKGTVVTLAPNPKDIVSGICLYATFPRAYRVTLDVVDLGEHQFERFDDCAQADYWMDMAHALLFLEHHPVARCVVLGKLGFGEYQSSYTINSPHD